MMASFRPRLTAITLLLPAFSARNVQRLMPLSQLSSMPAIQRRTCTIVARGGRGRKPGDKGPPREPRTLQHSLDGQPPEIARTYPEQYDELLSTKVGLLETLLEDATGGGALPPMEVFESQREHFRMRASFATWREEAKVYYIMFNKDDERRLPHAVHSYPMGSKRINELMPLVLAAVETDPALNRKIADIRFVTTLIGDALVVMTYNRPIDQDSTWEDAAVKLAEELGVGPAMQPVKIVGRSRKVKIVVNGETVQEMLTVGGKYQRSKSGPRRAPSAQPLLLLQACFCRSSMPASAAALCQPLLLASLCCFTPRQPLLPLTSESAPPSEQGDEWEAEAFESWDGEATTDGELGARQRAKSGAQHSLLLLLPLLLLRC